MKTSMAHANSTPFQVPAQAPDGADREAIKAIEDELVAHFADLAGMFALPRSYGQIYGLLFASAQPLSFTDIVARLDLSKGSVSQGMHALRAVGAIHPAEGPDWRREHFVAEIRLRALIGGYLRETITPQLKRGLNRVERLRDQHRVQLGAGNGKVLRDRLAQLRRWHRKGGAVLPVVAKLLG
jgi:DNA-binding transcriptional regulator GbsR (MarR family)